MFVKCSPSSIEGRVKHKKSIIFQFIVADKVVFGAIYSSWVVNILQQLFTSVSLKVVNIYLAASGLGKYPPPFTSNSVNNCTLTFIQIREQISFFSVSFLSFFLRCGIRHHAWELREALITVVDCWKILRFPPLSFFRDEDYVMKVAWWRKEACKDNFFCSLVNKIENDVKLWQAFKACPNGKCFTVKHA